MGPFLVMGLGGVVAYLLYQELGSTEHPTADMKAGCRGKANPALARTVAQKWGPIFGCPVETMLAIAKIESGFRPDCANFDIRALSRGGAYGMFQQTLATAKGHAAALVGHPNAAVRATLAKFRGPKDLLDPDVCGMFAARQLGELTKRFKDFKAVAGGYHQGAGKIASVLAQGGKIPDNLPPKGFTYVTRAMAAKETV